MPETWGGASLSSVNASWLLAETKERSCPLLAGCVSSVQFSSVQFSWSVLSDSLQPHRLRTVGLPVHHQLLELSQTHVH